MHHIFVYGSLKRGFRQHDRHLKSARFVAATQTKEPAFSLVAVFDPDADQAYPGMIPHGSMKIRGELYEIDDPTLARLDEYEGETYSRAVLELENGHTSFSYLYIGQDVPVDHNHPRIRIHGDVAEWTVEG